jgi:hypothetical protein
VLVAVVTAAARPGITRTPASATAAMISLLRTRPRMDALHVRELSEPWEARERSPYATGAAATCGSSLTGGNLSVSRSM